MLLGLRLTLSGCRTNLCLNTYIYSFFPALLLINWKISFNVDGACNASGVFCFGPPVEKLVFSVSLMFVKVIFQQSVIKMKPLY